MNIERPAFFECLFPLHPTLKHDSSFYGRSVDRLFEFFSEPQKLRFRGAYYHNQDSCSLSLVPCSKEIKSLFADNMMLSEGDAILRIEGEVCFPGKDKFFAVDHAGKKILDSEDRRRELWRSYFPHDLDPILQTYLCALSIALPGAVRPTSNAWIVDGIRHSFSKMYVSQTHEACEFLIENGFLPSDKIHPNEAIEWVFSQNGILDGYSDTPASRSLNFFTRLFVGTFRNDELSDLIWALAGIEAALVEGGRSSMGQLREKLGALFFPSTQSNWFEGMIKTMYDYRSRMIHGNRQIKSEFRSAEDDGDSRFNEEYDSVLFAIGVLLMLLQRLIELQQSKLTFKTVLG